MIFFKIAPEEVIYTRLDEEMVEFCEAVSNWDGNVDNFDIFFRKVWMDTNSNIRTELENITDFYLIVPGLIKQVKNIYFN